MLVTMVVDPLPAMQKELEQLRLAPKGPVVSDRSGAICDSYASYGVNCQHMGGKPGHAFVLVDKEGQIKWQKDYGGQMYVEVDEVVATIGPRL